MKRYFLLLFALICSLGAAAQEEEPAAPKSPFPIVTGVYKGKAICNTCDYILASLELEQLTDSTGTFSLVEQYVNEPKESETEADSTENAKKPKPAVKAVPAIASRVKGDWMITYWPENKKAFLIVLNYDNLDKAMYFVRKLDGNLQPLDKEKGRLDAAFDLTLKKF